MTEPSLEDRDRLRRAVGGVLFNASNFPERVQSRILGENMGPLNEKLTNAALDAGFRLPDPAHDAQVLRDAVERFELSAGLGDFAEQSARAGVRWGDAEEAWEHQGPFMDWFRNEADRIAGGTSHE